MQDVTHRLLMDPDGLASVPPDLRTLPCSMALLSNIVCAVTSTFRIWSMYVFNSAITPQTTTDVRIAPQAVKVGINNYKIHHNFPRI
jgi:hypothetical protein